MIKIELTPEEKARAKELVDQYTQRPEKVTYVRLVEGEWKDATKQEEG